MSDANYKDATRDLAEQGYVEPLITNFKMIDGEKKPVPVPLTMPEILSCTREVLGNWPRVIDEMPFIDETERGLQLFDRELVSSVIGWMQGKCKMDWRNVPGGITKGEFVCELTRTAERYKSVEWYPHEPLIPNVYYRPNNIKPGDGKHLIALLDRYNPETTADRQFIKAALMTLVWGGSPGSRPNFVITSEHGRGVGKTKLVETVSFVMGEMPLSINPSDDIEKIKKRLLSKEGRRKRAFLVDNIKSRNLSWADLEGLITAHDISGTQLYVGEGNRRNLLTYFMTFNAAALSKDMAKRSVIIKIVRGTYNGAWLEETLAFIDKYRNEIIGDIIAALRVDPQSLDSHSRWGEWERDVLCRLVAPNELQHVILERQGESDTDTESASLLEEYFAKRLSSLGDPYDPLTAQVRIPNEIAVAWYNDALGIKDKIISASKAIRQLIDEGDIRRLSVDKCRTHGRCFVWTGADADTQKQPISNDLRLRMTGFTDVRD